MTCYINPRNRYRCRFSSSSMSI